MKILNLLALLVAASLATAFPGDELFATHECREMAIIMGYPLTRLEGMEFRLVRKSFGESCSERCNVNWGGLSVGFEPNAFQYSHQTCCCGSQVYGRFRRVGVPFQRSIE